MRESSEMPATMPFVHIVKKFRKHVTQNAKLLPARHTPTWSMHPQSYNATGLYLNSVIPSRAIICVNPYSPILPAPLYYFGIFCSALPKRLLNRNYDVTYQFQGLSHRGGHGLVQQK